MKSTTTLSSFRALLLLSFPLSTHSWSHPPILRSMSMPATTPLLPKSSRRHTYRSLHPPSIDDDIDEESPSTSRQILSLALPALVSLSIDPLMTMADTAFVGRYSPPSDPSQLAGLGSAASLLVFSFYIFNFLATATAPLVSSRRAAGLDDDAARLAGRALTLSFVLGAALAAALLVYATPLLRLMGTEMTGPRAEGYALQFLTVRALAAPAALVCSASAGILRGYLDAVTPTIVLVGSNLVNLALDAVLVAYLGWGPMGAGIATTVAEWIAAAAFLGVLAGVVPGVSSERRRNIAPSWELPRWEEIRPLVVASSSVFLRSVVLQIAMSSAAAMAARSTSVVVEGVPVVASGAAAASVAAHQIALQLWLLCSFLCDALATASQALVADGIGRSDPDSVKSVAKTVFRWGLALGMSLAVILWIGTQSGFLIDFFTQDEGTRIELSKLLTIVIFAQPLNSFVFAADGVLQGAEEFTYQAKAMALSVVTAVSVFAVLEYTALGRESILSGGGDTLVHVWYGLIALQSMRGLTSFVKLVDERGPIDLFGKELL
ncbi:hypothetical protein ACHAWX_004075 [Stephanocyclus meneghinianus]